MAAASQHSMGFSAYSFTPLPCTSQAPGPRTLWPRPPAANNSHYIWDDFFTNSTTKFCATLSPYRALDGKDTSTTREVYLRCRPNGGTGEPGLGGSGPGSSQLALKVECCARCSSCCCLLTKGRPTWPRLVLVCLCAWIQPLVPGPLGAGASVASSSKYLIGFAFDDFGSNYVWRWGALKTVAGP